MTSTPTLSFYKLQGAGNDFVVFLAEQLKCAESEKPRFIRALAERKLGIGCDQVLELTSLNPLAIQIWNQDGSQAEMCANGARAFALLAQDKKWIAPGTEKFSLLISGKTYALEAAPQSAHGFAINLGQPQYLGCETLAVQGPLSTKPTQIPVHLVTAPNPHAVVFLGTDRDDEWQAPAEFDFRAWGPLLERHARFPQRTNVEFVSSVVERGERLLANAKVWERGVGATLSSGSGSAAVATAVWQRIAKGATKLPVQIEMNGFILNVFQNDQGETSLAGPASIVAKGEFYWEP